MLQTIFMAKEYVAYEGNEFQIEWYYSPNGESQALEYYMSLNPSERKRVLQLFKVMGDTGKIYDITKFRSEGDKVYAFKPQPHRFLSFFLEGEKIIVTNAFWKKQDKMPDNEKLKAINA